MGPPKALIHIGGSYLQLPSIRWARELGLHVIVTDMNRYAQGFKIADQCEVISGNDIPSLLSMAYKAAREYQLIGAYSGSDFGLLPVAVINETFNFPGCHREAVIHSLDKSVSKSKWQRKNLPVPGGKSIWNYDELKSSVSELGLPVILKPVDSCGSQGIQSVWNYSDLNRAYLWAKKFSKAILVEQIIEGSHIDVNGLFLEGEFFRCGTMDRFFSKPPYHYPIWGCQPSSLTSSQEDEVYSVVEQASRVLDIHNGPVKADVIWQNDGPVILELAPRFHGDVSTANITPLSTSLNPIKAWLSYLIKQNPTQYLQQRLLKYAGWMGLFPENHGILAEVRGIVETRAIKGVKDVFIAVKPGSVIKNHLDNTTVCGFVWAEAKNREELNMVLTQACQTIEFVTKQKTGKEDLS